MINLDSTAIYRSVCLKRSQQKESWLWGSPGKNLFIYYSHVATNSRDELLEVTCLIYCPLQLWECLQTEVLWLGWLYWGLFYFRERKKINISLWLLDVDDLSGCFWSLSQPGLQAAMCLFPAKGAEAGQWEESPCTHPIAVGQQRGCTDMGLCQKWVDLVGQKITLFP